MTHVVNLFGGSGLGKTTTSLGVAYFMKLRRLHAELVREYVKNWAWEGKKVGQYDQVYIFGKQCKTESLLYGKVDFIVTDSPLLLSPMYEEFYSGRNLTRDAALGFMKQAETQEVVYHNFLLTRNKPFDQRGRYEDEATAKKVDVFVKSKLIEWGVPFTEITEEDEARVSVILDQVLKASQPAETTAQI